MDFKTFLPSDLLKPVVRYFYKLETIQGDAGEKKKLHIVADGCPGIIFQEKSKGKLERDHKILPAAFLFGPSTKPSAISLNGNFDALGVCFHPHALHALFGMNAELLTDSCHELDTLSAGRQSYLSEQLEEASSTEQQIGLLSAFILSKMNERECNNERSMYYALNQIIHSNGTVPLKSLQSHLCLTERSFERKFKQYVGISPKLFSRIQTFQSSLKQLNTNQFDKLSDLAQENNYTDQSHFIRSFKEFAGLSPSQYRKRSTEVTENPSELIF